MKKYIFILMTCALSQIACNDFLDLDESEYQTTYYQFSDFERVKLVATGVYGFVQDGFSDVEGTMIDAATDDAVYAWNTNNIKKFYDGSWSSINLIDERWNHLYSAIRASNYFLENCPADFPASIYLETYKERMDQLRNFPLEIRALRAYFHFDLLKRYNNIVIADRTYSIKEVNNLTPSSYDETVEWIVKECDEIIPGLPVSYKNTPNAEMGRVTKGMVMALKSRVLLYAASPLNNPANDRNKWLRAAKAAKEVIDLNVYKIVDEDITNNENAQGLIFGKRNGSDNSFERANFPIGFEREQGNSGICPSQNLVEAFDMKNGDPFDWENEEHRKRIMQEIHRDPRFAKTVFYNGSQLKGQTIESFVTGKNGLPKEGASPTSYYLRKHLRAETSLVAGSETSFAHVFPLFRYTEIWLNYAEALAEAMQDGDYKGSEQGIDYTISPAEAVNVIRARSGMPPLPAMDYRNFIQRLRNERRVELAFEGHRFWDIRRWKIGNQTNKVYGLRILLKPDGTFENGKILVQDRVWNDKMYFYPINAHELFKNENLNQNTGW